LCPFLLYHDLLFIFLLVSDIENLLLKVYSYFYFSNSLHLRPAFSPHSTTTPPQYATMKFALSSFLTLGGRNVKPIQPESPNQITSSPSNPRQKKRSYLACQRFIGKPMTRMEAQKKLDSCKNFRDMVAQEGDVIQNAIGLEYGTRLRSCVIQSKRNPYHHGNRAHY
jgi:hypothetical protein